MYSLLTLGLLFYSIYPTTFPYIHLLTTPNSFYPTPTLFIPLLTNIPYFFFISLNLLPNLTTFCYLVYYFLLSFLIFECSTHTNYLYSLSPRVTSFNLTPYYTIPTALLLILFPLSLVILFPHSTLILYTLSANRY